MTWRPFSGRALFDTALAPNQERAGLFCPYTQHGSSVIAGMPANSPIFSDPIDSAVRSLATLPLMMT